MGELKTHRTDTSVDTIISEIADDARREDCLALLGLMQSATGVAPEVWSSGLIGFGTYHYKSSSGQEGDWFPVGFASRKAAITVYLGMSLEGSAETARQVGQAQDRQGLHLHQATRRRRPRSARGARSGLVCAHQADVRLECADQRHRADGVSARQKRGVGRRSLQTR